MQTRIAPFAVLIALFVSMSSQPQSPASARQQDPASFVGVWRGEFDHLPAVDLVITDEGGELHGAILFYLHRRPDVNSPYTSTPGLPEPMLDLTARGDTVYFQVSHRRAHPPESLHDAPMKFHLKLLSPDRAELTAISHTD